MKIQKLGKERSKPINTCIFTSTRQLHGLQDKKEQKKEKNTKKMKLKKKKRRGRRVLKKGRKMVQTSFLDKNGMVKCWIERLNKFVNRKIQKSALKKLAVNQEIVNLLLEWYI